MSKHEPKTRILPLLSSGVLPTDIIEHIAKLSSPQTLVSCGQDKTIKLWDICTGECKRTLTGHSDIVTCISPYKGSVFFTGSNDCTVRQWDGTTGRCMNVFQGHTHYVNCVCTLTHRKVPLLVSGSRDKTIIAWRICANYNDVERTNQIESVIHTGGIFGVTSLAAAKNDSVLISGDADGHVRLWDTESWMEIPTTISGHNAAVEAIRVVELGSRTLVVTCGGDGDRSAKVWDMDTGECINTFKDHASGVWSADFVSVGGRCDDEVKVLTVSDSEAFVRSVCKTKKEDDSKEELIDLFRDMEPSWKTFTQINAVAFAQYCDPDVAVAWSESKDRKEKKEKEKDDEMEIEKVGTPSRVRKSGKKGSDDKGKKKKKKKEGVLDMCPLALARGKKIFLWSFPQMEKELELVGHTGFVYDLCFLPS